MAEFRVGDIVDITANGVEVVNTFGTGIKPVDGPMVDTGTVLVFRHPGETRRDRSHTVNLGAAGVTVVKVGDRFQHNSVWADNSGLLWLAQREPEGPDIRLYSVLGDYSIADADRAHGPFTAAPTGGGGRG